jgi:SAM-dependent methyltransferase
MNQFYHELAVWWPLLSPLSDYAEECDEMRAMFLARRPGARTLLDLGSGGGHVAHHLAKTFVCTLTDLSPEMIEVSRGLNPGCTHHVADMRTLDLGQRFDLVLVHDAIDSMTSEADLRAAMATAFRHLAPGGLALFLPDDLAETYEPGTDVSGGDSPDGRGARLFEWSEAPAPDGTAAVHYVFLLRETDGSVQTIHERHVSGLFSRSTWERLLREVGFTPEVVLEDTEEDRPPRSLFFGHNGEA